MLDPVMLGWGWKEQKRLQSRAGGAAAIPLRGVKRLLEGGCKNAPAFPLPDISMTQD